MMTKPLVHIFNFPDLIFFNRPKWVKSSLYSSPFWRKVCGFAKFQVLLVVVCFFSGQSCFSKTVSLLFFSALHSNSNIVIPYVLTVYSIEQAAFLSISLLFFQSSRWSFYFLVIQCMPCQTLHTTYPIYMLHPTTLGYHACFLPALSFLAMQHISMTHIQWLGFQSWSTSATQ